MFQIVDGSKEYVVVDLVDVTGAVSDLSGATPKFSTRKADGTPVSTLVAATASGMRIQCLIDTVAVSYDPGVHKLYVSFTIGSEVPLIYVTDFHVL